MKALLRLFYGSMKATAAFYAYSLPLLLLHEALKLQLHAALNVLLHAALKLLM